MAHPRWGFLGGSFFLILAPTSSVLPIRDLAFEHRMYLPLAPLVTAAVFAGYELLHRFPRGSMSGHGRRWVYAALVVLPAAGFGVTTFLRNEVYTSEISVWNDVVRKYPNNARGHANLARAFLERQEYASAADESERAIAIDPGVALIHNNFGLALAKLGDTEGAVVEIGEALRLNPSLPQAHLNLGNVLRATRPDKALRHYETAVQLEPRCSEAHNNLGACWRRPIRTPRRITIAAPGSRSFQCPLSQQPREPSFQTRASRSGYCAVS